MTIHILHVSTVLPLILKIIQILSSHPMEGKTLHHLLNFRSQWTLYDPCIYLHLHQGRPLDDAKIPDYPILLA